MATWSRLLAITSALVVVVGAAHLSNAFDGEREIHAAVARTVRANGYEVIEKRPGHESEVVFLEERDANAYGPSARMVFRLRSIRPWSRSANTYFRYWLARETYDSEERAQKRVDEYMKDYTERLATANESSFMISKTIIRVGAKRRDATVYLLVTDGAYTLSDDKGRDKMLDAVSKSKGT